MVRLTVSDGPGTASMPAVEGQTSAEARRRLEDAGFKVTVRQRASTRVKKGIAIETRPGEGTPVERGSTVILYVSTGPQTVAVPNVVGHAARRRRAPR